MRLTKIRKQFKYSKRKLSKKSLRGIKRNSKKSLRGGKQNYRKLYKHGKKKLSKKSLRGGSGHFSGSKRAGSNYHMNPDEQRILRIIQMTRTLEKPGLSDHDIKAIIDATITPVPEDLDFNLQKYNEYITMGKRKKLCPYFFQNIQSNPNTDLFNNSYTIVDVDGMVENGTIPKPSNYMEIGHIATVIKFWEEMYPEDLEIPGADHCTR